MVKSIAFLGVFTFESLILWYKIENSSIYDTEPTMFSTQISATSIFNDNNGEELIDIIDAKPIKQSSICVYVIGSLIELLF